MIPMVLKTPINEKSPSIGAMEIEREITKAYIVILNRMPDPLGNEIYQSSIARGYIKLDQVRNDLKSSPEYKGYIKKIKSGEIGSGDAYVDKDGNIVWLKKVNEEYALRILDKRYNTDNTITFVSTWGIKCGIATYTKYLMDAINKEYNNIADIYSINTGTEWDKVNGNIIELEHEFGIMPHIINSDSKVIITFHSITKDILETMTKIEEKLNVVGYIVHFKEAKEYIDNVKEKVEMESRRGKSNYDLIKEKERREGIIDGVKIGNRKQDKEKKVDVWIIPHGSKKIPNIEKEKVRELLGFDGLGIRPGEDVALVFGFQSGNKNFNRLIKACRNVGIKIIVSGSVHECGYKNDISKDGKEEIDKGNVIFLGRYLDEIETDLYALGSDILLFDYVPQDHYSCSGALHRIIGSGRPCIVSNTNHFLDVRENDDGVLKFSGQLDLEQKIREGLERRDELGKKAGEYAEKTSWDKIAIMRLDIYGKYIDLDTDTMKGSDNDIEEKNDSSI
jgi:hypothetical protein